MKIPFTKYHGTGNDFVLISGQQLAAPLSEGEIERLCDRHFGIGADGLILVNPSDNAGIDYEMLYYNADGRVGSMCGNGARCAFHFAQSLKLAGNEAQFLAYDGAHTATMHEDLISVSMRDVNVVQQPSLNVFILDTGSPHYIRFVEDIGVVDVLVEGRAMRQSPEFSKNGINVNFVQVLNDGIRLRTYERGVEDITLSCGTGATAAVLAYATLKESANGPVKAQVDGGMLTVDFERSLTGFTNILLSGPVMRVFDGEYVPST